MLFVIKFFLTIASYQFEKNDLVFYKSWLIYSRKLFSTTLLFSILKTSKKSSNIDFFLNVSF